VDEQTALTDRTDGARAYVRASAQRARAAVAEHLASGERVALLDFPAHENVGDSAIWLGEKELLAGAGVEVAYQSDMRGYSSEALRRAMPSGVVLIHGGGNLGDRYPQTQAFRERVVDELRDHRIVQLPQTVDFRSAREQARAAAALARHDDLVVLARDGVSAATLQAMGLRHDVVPDSAFLVSLIRSPPTLPGAATTYLLRSDDERTGPPFPGPGHDWSAMERGTVTWPGRRAPQRLPSPVRGTAGLVPRPAWDACTRSAALARRIVRQLDGGPSRRAARFDAVAARRVHHGLAQLADARFVVTDRLHGAILGLLLGRAVVAVDTGYGKISSYFATFPAPAQTLRVTTTFDDVPSLLASLGHPEMPELSGRQGS